MAEEAMPSSPAVADSTLVGNVRRGPTAETILYLVILLLALTSRFALLDSQALHHDEGIHTLFGWNIYQGSGYTHDAVYHGPFIYHANALSFLVFGDNDFTARLMPALFSAATVMLPLLLRRQLGRWGALLACFLLLISPSFLYFGRFARNDVFGAFWTLLLFVCMVRYLATRHNGWLYGTAATASLYFSTKETAYITIAVFGLFLLGRLLWDRYSLHAFWPLLGLLPVVLEEFWKSLAKEAIPLPQISLGPLSLSIFSLVPLALAGLAVAAMLAWRWWEGWARKERSSTLDLVVILGTMVLPLLSAVPLNLLVRLRGLEIDYHSADIPQDVVILAVISIALTFALAAAVGLPWDVRRWSVAAGIFWGIFFLLHTSFFSSMTGWATGLIQALGFWLSQQGVKRIHIGPQYYLIITPVYETVSVAFGLVGTVFFAWRGLVQLSPGRQVETTAPVRRTAPLGAPLGVTTGMLAWWAPVGFVVYSLAGEQVPWLNVHPTLPFLLLTAALLGRMISYRPRRPVSEDYAARLITRRRAADGALLLLAGVLLVWAGRSLFSGIATGTAWLISVLLLLGAAYLAFHATRADRRGELAFLILGGVALGMAAIGATHLSFSEGYTEWWSLYVPLGLAATALVVRAALLGRSALRTGALLLFGFLCAFSLSSAWRLTYINNDTPVEMLVYVQTSSDMQWAVDELEALSTLTTGAKDIVFLYDSEIAWPGEWYFRNYPNKVYQSTIAGPPSEDAAMVFVYRDKDNTSSPYLERRFQATRYYAFNWWFPEENIRSSRVFIERMAPEILEGVEETDWPQVLQALTRPSAQARVWRYLQYREMPSAIGAREVVIYVRNDLVAPLEWLKDTIPRR